MKILPHLWIGSLLLYFLVPIPMSAGAVDLDHEAMIESSGGGPYFQLILPITIYPTAANAGLTDVRVRNADGEMVPHAWLDDTTSERLVFSEDAPLYPISAGKKGDSAGQADLSLHFKQNANGSLLTVQSDSAALAAEPETKDWVIDLSQIKGSQLKALFTVNDEAEGLFPLILESSDDLRYWRTINGDAQIAILKRPGGKIENLAVDLNGNREKFLRLHWTQPAQFIAVTSATIISVLQDESITPMQWSGPIKPSTCAVDYCDYLLPAKTPLNSLRINLGEPNTLAAVTISAKLPQVQQRQPKRQNPLYVIRHRLHPHDREKITAAEVILGQIVVYRLTQPNGEVRSEELALDGSTYARLRIQTDGPISLLGQHPPTIEVASIPRRLVFLGSGSPPFTLHWGVDDIGPALSPATLIPGYQPGEPIQASLATVDISAMPTLDRHTVQIAVQAEPHPSISTERKVWLWAALAGGLLLLAGMAWSLFRGIDRASKDSDSSNEESQKQ